MTKKKADVYVEAVTSQGDSESVTFAVYPEQEAGQFKAFALFSGIGSVSTLKNAFAAGVPIYLDGTLWGYGTFGAMS